MSKKTSKYRIVKRTWNKKVEYHIERKTLFGWTYAEQIDWTPIPCYKSYKTPEEARNALVDLLGPVDEVVS